MNDYSLEHVLSFTGIGDTAPEALGAVPEGIRVNFYNAGGTVSAVKAGEVYVDVGTLHGYHEAVKLLMESDLALV